MISAQKSNSLLAVVTAVLLLACLCFGGSASVSVYEMGLSIFALVCGVVVFWSSASAKINGPISWIILAFILLIVIQLIPLPDAVWNLLPQAQFSDKLLPNSHLRGMWKSLSIVPDATLYSLIAAVPTLIISWLVVNLNEAERMNVANILVVAVIFQALIGIAQATGALSFSMYDYYHKHVAIGLFASRNHFADLILMGTCLLFVVRQSWFQRYGRTLSEVTFYSLFLILLFAMIASASRAGLILFILLVFTCFVLITRRNTLVTALFGGSIFGGLLWANFLFLPQTGVLKTTLARFEATDDGRWEIWKNSEIVANYYWPWGVGIGGFRQAYEHIELPENVGTAFVNSVHNELLQLLLEAGILGFILGLISVGMIFYFAWINRKDTSCNLVFCGIIIIIIHSFVDYPLRALSVTAMISFLIGFLIFYPKISRGTSKNVAFLMA